MNAAYVAEYSHTDILEDAKDVDNYTAKTAWFQTFPQATIQECFVSTAQEELFHQNQTLSTVLLPAI